MARARTIASWVFTRRSSAVAGKRKARVGTGRSASSHTAKKRSARLRVIRRSVLVSTPPLDLVLINSSSIRQKFAALSGCLARARTESVAVSFTPSYLRLAPHPVPMVRPRRRSLSLRASSLKTAVLVRTVSRRKGKFLVCSAFKSRSHLLPRPANLHRQLPIRPPPTRCLRASLLFVLILHRSISLP